MRYIDADALNLYDNLFMKGKNDNGVWVKYKDVEELIKRAPSIDLGELQWLLEMVLRQHKSSNEDDADEIYAKAIIYSLKTGGDVFYINDFIESVHHHSIMNCDGIGVALTADGEEIKEITCDEDYLIKLKNKGCVYIAWYNK